MVVNRVGIGTKLVVVKRIFFDGEPVAAAKTAVVEHHGVVPHLGKYQPVAQPLLDVARIGVAYQDCRMLILFYGGDVGNQQVVPVGRNHPFERYVRVLLLDALDVDTPAWLNAINGGPSQKQHGN